MKMTSKIALFVFYFTLSVPVYSQGIPTIDAASVAQMTAQIAETKKLLFNAEQQLKSLTGNANIGRLLYDSDLISYIPDSGDWSEIFDSDLSPLLEQYGLESENPDVQKIYEKEVAVMLAAEKSYEAQNQRLANIEALMDRANLVQTPQQRDDLSNAISIEKAAIQLEQNRIIALQETIKQDRDLEEKRASQELRSYFGRE